MSGAAASGGDKAPAAGDAKPEGGAAEEGGKAGATAWLAVAAGTLGALMSTLDISIVNSSLPTIQGEIGASGTEGTWIATSYLVAEIVVIPLSGWLEKLLTLRTFLLICSGMFTLFSVVCGLSDSLGMMVIGRVGQGFFGGALIPTAMTIIATYLPRSQQAIGNAAFGATAVLGPVVGPVLGGWLTESYSWHYAFFINLPLGVGLFILLLFAMEKEEAHPELLADADWLGIAGLALGLGCMTVALEEGQNDQWFDSPLIVWMTILSAIGFILLFIGQKTAKAPVIDLGLLLDRQFASVTVMATVVGMILFGISYAIPQYLSALQGYNALQSGLVVLMSGIPMMLMMPILPFMLKNVDIRIAVGGGFAMLAYSSYILAYLSPDFAGAQFTMSQLIRGVGTVMAIMFLNQAAIQSVPPEKAADASGLFNAARNLGGSLALAGITVLQDKREWLHERRLEETLNGNAVDVQSYVDGLAKATGNAMSAYQSIGQQVQQQALTMTYADLFWVVALITAVVTPLIVFLRPLPKDADPVMAG